MTLINRIFAALVVLMGLGLLLGGIYLATLGGSLYYVLAGLAYLIAGILLWRRQARGVWLLVLVAVLTIPWALWESGTFYWALFPRLLVPLALASLGLLLLPSVLPEASRGTMLASVSWRSWGQSCSSRLPSCRMASFRQCRIRLIRRRLQT